MKERLTAYYLNGAAAFDCASCRKQNLELIDHEFCWDCNLDFCEECGRWHEYDPKFKENHE